MSRQRPARSLCRPAAPRASSATPVATPLGALAAGFGLLTLSGAALAQQVAAPAAAASVPAAVAEASAAAVDAVLPQVTVRGKRIDAPGKQTLNVSNTSIGKGNQALRDIPQSVTVVTEKLMDDRNLDTLKEALKNTAGITFLAAEGGEEDIRLRGFSLQATGDIFIDGLRDPAIYDRDTFNLDRMELLRGSASMLFGRGSTGGAVNQVSKAPRLIDENQIDVTVGSGAHKRIVGDFNRVTGESSAIRVNAMVTDANNNGSGSAINKRGLAAAFRTGIGEQDEFIASLYHLDNNNGVNYGLPFVTPYTGAPATVRSLMNQDPSTSYALDSDYNHSSGTIASLGHTHRFSSDSELKTQFRVGSFKRDLRASAIRFAGATAQPGGVAVTSSTLTGATVLTRGTNLKVQDMKVAQVQSDYSSKFEALGFKHEVLTGVDLSKETKTVYGDAPGLSGANRALLYAAEGLTKPNTTVGTPSDGASVDESLRQMFQTSDYSSSGWGAYVQDMVQVTPHLKLLGGLRYDNLKGDYNSYAYTYSGAAGTHGYDKFAAAGTTSYRMSVSELSKRVGALYQPNDRESYHVSAATSFNTSGDAYSLGSDNANTPPEQSINLELGAKLDSADKRFATRLAVFRSTKLNERNTDPDLPIVTLSGRRHVAGFEIDVTGKINPQWEVYGSYMWLPIAKVDAAAPCPATGACTQAVVGERVGDRPALTPKNSGTVWSTYQLDQQWRVGGGINFRGKQRPTRSEFHVAGYATADVMAEYKANEQLTVKANLSNVANKLYADQLYPGHYIAGAGRQLQVTASLKF